MRCRLPPSDFKRLQRAPQLKVIRRALGLTQEEFAGCFHIPLVTLHDWEQGAAVPDQSTRAYLTVIARNPEAVRKTLASAYIGERRDENGSIGIRYEREFARTGELACENWLRPSLMMSCMRLDEGMP